MKPNNLKIIHDKYAPYWAIALFILLGTGLLASSFNFGRFWKGYILDMVGPAWAYILFRGLYTTKANNLWTQFFTPNRTLIIFITVCFGIEALQYFKVYDSTFDFWDLLAYITILTPLFFIDKKIIQKGNKSPFTKSLNKKQP